MIQDGGRSQNKGRQTTEDGATKETRHRTGRTDGRSGDTRWRQQPNNIKDDDYNMGTNATTTTTTNDDNKENKDANNKIIRRSKKKKRKDRKRRKKSEIRIDSHNVHGLTTRGDKRGKLEEIIQGMIREKTYVVLIQETWLDYDEMITTDTGFLVLTSGNNKIQELSTDPEAQPSSFLRQQDMTG